MKFTTATLAGVAGIFLAAAPANAAVTVFGDRTTFAASAGSTTTTTFASFGSDTSFGGVPLDVGPFSVQTTGPTASFSGDNIVDVVPLSSFETDVNGTAHLRVFQALGSSFFITLDAPSTAFGADFQSLNDNAYRTALFLDGAQVAGPIVNGSGFFGLTSTTAFSSIEFRGILNDRFGVDNVTVSAPVGAVPEPGTWAMMLFGFGGIGVAMRRRRKPTNVAQLA